MNIESVSTHRIRGPFGNKDKRWSSQCKDYVSCQARASEKMLFSIKFRLYIIWCPRCGSGTLQTICFLKLKQSKDILCHYIQTFSKIIPLADACVISDTCWLIFCRITNWQHCLFPALLSKDCETVNLLATSVASRWLKRNLTLKLLLKVKVKRLFHLSVWVLFSFLASAHSCF